ncbi:MAG: OmpH family outer membrane protein [Prevotella sp.]|nr:OmpH family outer membrane protein [Prevotella sp.]MBQ9222833.1 OmpH family outer membrane protein [Prevotella sp.]
MKKIIMVLMLMAPMATFAQKFGHVDAQSIMQAMPEFIKARGDLEAQSKEYENDLKAMQDELQRKSETYDKTKSTMNATKQQETETELQQMFAKIQQANQDYQQQLNKMQQEKLAPIMNKVTTAIQNVGKNGGYVYIMDASMGIPYISQTLSKDVTADVKAEIQKMK